MLKKLVFGFSAWFGLKCRIFVVDEGIKDELFDEQKSEEPQEITLEKEETTSE